VVVTLFVEFITSRVNLLKTYTNIQVNEQTVEHSFSLFILCLLENGRYGHAPIRSDTSTPCVGVPATCNIRQAGLLENAAYTQWVAHADH